MDSIILDKEFDKDTRAQSRPVIRDNRGRARTAIIFLWVMIVVNITLIVSFALQFKMWWDNFDSFLDFNTYTNNQIRQALLSRFYYLALIVSSVFFIRWFRRAYRNLHVIDDAYLSCTEGWAAGAWFVPVVHWFRPYVIMREICEQMPEHAAKSDGRFARPSKLAVLCGWWWALWVITPVLLRSSQLMSRETAVIKLLLIATAMVIAGFILELICALLAIRIIRKVSLAEQEIFEDHERMKYEEAYTRAESQNTL